MLISKIHLKPSEKFQNFNQETEHHEIEGAKEKSVTKCLGTQL